ncbi:MAG: N4-gp56 family major capsid protein [Deltaproteobacteria bacterium]|nr:MAG: N4-gp56 family major capsid protein [Deltaproteobacteria bacterium]
MGINNVGQAAYNDPINGVPSSIGPQITTHHYVKQALIEAQKVMFFGPLADVTSMPKNMGKTIKRFHYIPLLDDANINDQGIDAQGLSTEIRCTIVMRQPGVQASPFTDLLAVGTNADDASATTSAENTAVDMFKSKGVFDTDYATTKSVLTALSPPWVIDDTTYANGNGVPSTGNLYGSSKDVGAIVNKLPVLSEFGGTVNRVGFTRVELEGTLEKYGFYDRYTEESLNFDTDAELEMHINREMIFGANEINEDLIQIDLLNSAGVIYFAGDAASDDEISGETGAITEVTYGDLSRLSVELDQNRCPKQTTIISGSRMIDTRVIRGGRLMYVGSELTQTLEQMEDYFNNQAFISSAHYAAAANILNGEIGTVGQFRIIVVPEMMHWAGTGAAVTDNAGYKESGGKYDVYPMLVIGDASFTTIGFQTSNSKTKFTVKHSKPGSPESYAGDPFGETGFTSIKWYYGFMVLRPERIGIIKTVARY